MTAPSADRLNAALGAATIHLEAANDAAAAATAAQAASHQQSYALTALAHVATGIGAVLLAFAQEEVE